MINKFYTFIFILLFTNFYILLPNICIYSAYINTSKMIIDDDILEITKNNRVILLDDGNTENEFIPTITIDRTEQIVDDVRYNITEEEFDEFVRVVEAEVTGDNPVGAENYNEVFNSKLRVAQVILNRVESPHFPDTVHDVIFQRNAFTPLVDGRYYEVEISQVTIDACKAALLTTTEDITYGCEFFMSRSNECRYGSYVFTDDVGHSFFKSYYDN